MMQSKRLEGNWFVRAASSAAIVVLASAASLAFAPGARAAEAGYIRVVNAQGVALDGGSKDAAHVNWVTVSTVVSNNLNGDAHADRESSSPSMSELTATSSAKAAAAAPRDASAGVGTGRRMHKPLTITKEIDKASPLLAKACASGEHLKEVDVDLGAGQHYMLSDVVIASDTKAGNSETLSFTYQKIEISK